MGGKTKKLDPQLMQRLYSEGTQFRLTVEEEVIAIKAELAKLTDPSFQAGLSGGQGDRCKEAIAGVVENLTELESSIKRVTKFLDDKLFKILEINNKDTSGFTDSKDKAKSNQSNMKIKK